MSENTKIEWADATFSPWQGCTKISEGCRYCYMEAWARRAGKDVMGHPVATADSGWATVIGWQRKLAVTKSRMSVFPSLCDPLDPSVPLEWFMRWMRMIHATPNIDHLCLTKRPSIFTLRMFQARKEYESTKMARAMLGTHGWPNMHWGISAENQERYDERVEDLRRLPGKNKFVSYEPALGPIRFNFEKHDHISWVIVGGESGSSFRIMDMQCVVGTVVQCIEAGVACFVKQDSGPKPGTQGRIDAALWELKQLPEWLKRNRKESDE